MMRPFALHARPRRRLTAAAAALAALATVAAACRAGPGPADVARLRDRAQTVLDRWATAGAGASSVGLVGELTGQLGTWEAEVGDNNKSALYAGLLSAGPTMTVADGASEAEVTWPSGDSVSVPVLTATEAIAAVRASAGDTCTACQGLVATEARLTTADIQTTRGVARGPVWTFDLEGTAVQVTRVAIANPTAVPPLAEDPGDIGVVARVDDATPSADGRSLTLGFVGSPRPGNEACGEDYTAEAIESEVAVVVIVYRHPNPSLGACTAEGARRTAVATLAQSLGGRAVLDVVDGTPVPIVPAS